MDLYSPILIEPAGSNPLGRCSRRYSFGKVREKPLSLEGVYCSQENQDVLLLRCEIRVLKNRQIILELKTLKTDPEEKVETLLELYRECPEFPIFYGELPLNRVLSCHPKGEEILHRIADALTRSVQGAMEKADDCVTDRKPQDQEITR